MENITVSISANDLTNLICRVTSQEYTIKHLEEENKKLKKQLEDKENEQ